MVVSVERCLALEAISAFLLLCTEGLSSLCKNISRVNFKLLVCNWFSWLQFTNKESELLPLENP